MEDTCPKCGSAKIIPSAQILDQGEYSDGILKVVVYGHPEALIFKDRVFAHLSARICGDCGFAELYAQEAAALYAAYRKAVEAATRSQPGADPAEGPSPWNGPQ